jgi:hypothetical protein
MTLAAQHDRRGTTGRLRKLTAAEKREILQRAHLISGNLEAGNKDGPRFKGTPRKLDALCGVLCQRPKGREPSIREEAGDPLRRTTKRWYHRSIRKKWNTFLELKR